MSVGKASIKRAAGAGKPKSTAGTVNEAVLTPMDSEQIQVKFLSGKSPLETENRPVRLTEAMPSYLL